MSQTISCTTWVRSTMALTSRRGASPIGFSRRARLWWSYSPPVSARTWDGVTMYEPEWKHVSHTLLVLMVTIGLTSIWRLLVTQTLKTGSTMFWIVACPLQWCLHRNHILAWSTVQNASLSKSEDKDEVSESSSRGGFGLGVPPQETQNSVLRQNKTNFQSRICASRN